MAIDNAFGPFDVDYVVAENLVVTRGGVTVSPDAVRIALVPAGQKTSSDTEWYNTVPLDNGPALLVRGPLAPANAQAVEISQNLQAHAEIAIGSLRVVVDLGRVPYRA
jgi:hypothetical protein